MNEARILFVPVSGPRGMGEYARTLAIADAITRRWPRAGIHFLLSGEAPYARDTPYPKTLLPSSATFHTREVISLIAEYRPSVVLFDNAGRTAQLAAAAREGARVVFVSSRGRQRRRAFRVRWMKVIHEHWIAYPRFIAGDIGAVEALKLRILGRPRVRFLDTIVPWPDDSRAPELLQHHGVQPGGFLLVVPGGGTEHRGARDAPRIIAEAARGIARRGIPTILVGVAGAGAGGEIAALRDVPRMPMDQLMTLVRHAGMVVSNGGDTLLQALAYHRPCVAMAIAGDQGHRIDKCVRLGLAVRSRSDPRDLEERAVALFEDSESRQELQRRLRSLDLHNGLDDALEALHRLVSEP